MNTGINILTEHYNKAAQSESYTIHQQFIDELLLTNEKETLDFHYDLLHKSINNLTLYKRLCRAFEQRDEVGQNYLLQRIITEPDHQIKGDVLHILGKMRLQEIVPLSISFLKSDDRNLRYKAIIVLGWVGQHTELPLLQEHLQYDSDEELRGYSATAMRQIWFRLPQTQQAILEIYLQAIEQEKSEPVCADIIACTQDLLKKKFGVKQSQYGEISGDVLKAKPKAIVALKNYLDNPK